MLIAIEGCAHGSLDEIYSAIVDAENEKSCKVDLLICCGDFQSVRNQHDLEHMACPPKFRKMNTFYKYYTGEAVAPVLTIFIGGNHEAGNYLDELEYGGWVAPRIYYLGRAGCVQFGGIRIAGFSGIYKGYDFNKGLYEMQPFSEHNCKTIYHTRQWDLFRLALLSPTIDIVVSHDWPTIATKFGDTEQLCRNKPHFKAEIESGTLGSPASSELLTALRPAFWFSGHLHVKFASIIPHDGEDRVKTRVKAPFVSSNRTLAHTYSVTRFLALDKCLPGRRFMQFMSITSPLTEDSPCLCYDIEWLTVLRKTHSHTPLTQFAPMLPEIKISAADISETERLLGSQLKQPRIPENFTISATAYPGNSAGKCPWQNSQRTCLLNLLQLEEVRYHHATNSKDFLNAQIDEENWKDSAEIDI